MTCQRCGAPPTSETPLLICSLNVRGLGMWEWKLCSGCAPMLTRAALLAVQPLQAPEGQGEMGAVVVGEAETAPTYDNPANCEICGRLTLRDDGRCAYHPIVEPT